MKTYKVLGMMSGTSLDGLDLAFCHFSGDGSSWDFSIEATKEVSYEINLRERLKNAIHLEDDDHNQLHIKYGNWLGEQAKSFIKEGGFEIDFIASHGHTSHHRPEEGITFQLGHGQYLANTSNHKVICDFRTNDVSLGGQGAPLAPIGDHLLFNSYDFCLNLGGISNISFEKDGKRLALDIGMANMPLNHITRNLGLEYDDDGKLARSGNLDTILMSTLNGLEYYQLPHPKSTGYEWFLAKVVPLLERTKSPNADILHTLIHHNCEQIAHEVKKHATKPKHTVFVTGGGAFNTFFTDTLQQKLGADIQIVIPSKELIAYKEALVFALMGVLRNENQINVLSSVTGAKENSSSGEIFLPNPS